MSLERLKKQSKNADNRSIYFGDSKTQTFQQKTLGDLK